MENRIILNDPMTDGLWTKAIMHFPNNSKLRESWYTAHSTNCELQGAKSDEIFHVDSETLKKLLNSPSMNELKELSTKALKKGVIAGDLLASIYLMNKFKLLEPSINKAAYILRESAKENQYGDNSALPKTDKTIIKYFKEYQSVAHLWAAFRLNSMYHFSAIDQIYNENLSIFFDVSQELLDFGTSFIASRKKSSPTLLHHSESWLLPEGTTAKTLESDQRPDLMEKILKSYDAMEYRLANDCY